jgi:hypothetical protein
MINTGANAESGEERGSQIKFDVKRCTSLIRTQADYYFITLNFYQIFHGSALLFLSQVGFFNPIPNLMTLLV